MNSKHLIAAAALVTTGLVTAELAMAYQAGDTFVRGGIAMAEVTDDNAPLEVVGQREMPSTRNIPFSGSHLFSDRLGIELNGTGAGDYRLSTQALGGVARRPENLMVSSYPMGNSGSRTEPYLGAGLNYTHFSEEELEEGDLDMAVTNSLRAGAFARHPDVSIEGTALGEADNEPMPLGGATFRF